MCIDTKPGREHQYKCRIAQYWVVGNQLYFPVIWSVWSEENLYRNLAGLSDNSVLNDFFMTAYSKC